MGGVPHKIHPGERYGRLLITRYVGLNKFHCRLYHCKCDCGGEKITQSQNLFIGKTKSCGCLQKEHASRVSKSRRLPKDGSSVGVVLSKYKHHATKRGLPFEITREEFDALIRKPCHYCGAGPDNVNRRRFKYNGVDKIVPKLGYVIGNVAACCWPCNRAKGNRSVAEFVEWLKRIHAHQASGAWGMETEEAP